MQRSFKTGIEDDHPPDMLFSYKARALSHLRFSVLGHDRIIKNRVQDEDPDAIVVACFLVDGRLIGNCRFSESIQ